MSTHFRGKICTNALEPFGRSKNSCLPAVYLTEKLETNVQYLAEIFVLYTG